MLANWIDQLVFREPLLRIDFLFDDLNVDCLTNFMVFVKLVIVFVERPGGIKCSFEYIQSLQYRNYGALYSFKSMPKPNNIIS